MKIVHQTRNIRLQSRIPHCPWLTPALKCTCSTSCDLLISRQKQPHILILCPHCLAYRGWFMLIYKVCEARVYILYYLFIYLFIYLLLLCFFNFIIIVHLLSGTSYYLLYTDWYVWHRKVKVPTQYSCGVFCQIWYYVYNNEMHNYRRPA